MPAWLSLTVMTLLGGLLHTYAFPIGNEKESIYDNEKESNYDIESSLSVPDLTSLYDYETEMPNAWPSEKNLPEKRGPCHGTACVYSHIGAKAGHSSLRRLKLTLLRECIDDPLCFAAGRRKRSTKSKNPNVLKTKLRLLKTSLSQRSP